MPWTVARLLAWTREYLERSKVESPRLCAEILLAHAMGCQRIALFTRHESVPESAVLDRFREHVKQAATGKPIAYLTGTKEFFALSFDVSPAVLIPRPETEVLVERTIGIAKQAPAETPVRILDIGTGSGCIAIALAKNLPTAQIVAIDISSDALDVARKNATKHGVAERITLHCGDLFAPLAASDAFDIIVSNPPYIALREQSDIPPNVRDFEPHTALFSGEDGFDALRRIVVGARSHLNNGGHLLTEIAYNQSHVARKLFADAGWSEIVCYKDGISHDRVVHARIPAAAAAQVA